VRHGPVQVAKNESEVFKTTYEDPDLARVYKMNEAALRTIYLRYKNAGVDFYYDGIAIVGLKKPAREYSRSLCLDTDPTGGDHI
jgi:hypothetical protein